MNDVLGGQTGIRVANSQYQAPFQSSCPQGPVRIRKVEVHENHRRQTVIKSYSKDVESILKAWQLMVVLNAMRTIFPIHQSSSPGTTLLQ